MTAAALLQAIGLFIATNIDDIIVLSLFFARGAGRPGTTAKILAGQYLIVTFGGKMFNVVPLSWTDWGLIFAGTSLVLWFGELARAFTPDKSGARS